MRTLFLSFIERKRERESEKKVGIAVRDTRLGAGVENTMSSV
jgi:hypothetical protein